MRPPTTCSSGSPTCTRGMSRWRRTSSTGRSPRTRAAPTFTARAGIDACIGSYEATADLLLLGVRVARAQGDRVGAQRYARRLQLDFPGTDQARALAELDRNPG